MWLKCSELSVWKTITGFFQQMDCEPSLQAHRVQKAWETARILSPNIRERGAVGIFMIARNTNFSSHACRCYASRLKIPTKTTQLQ